MQGHGTTQTPGNGLQQMADQMGWISNILGDDFWAHVQEEVRNAVTQPSRQAGRGGPMPAPGQGSAPTSQRQPQSADAGGPPVNLYVTPGEVVLTALVPGLTGPNGLRVGLSGQNKLVLEVSIPPASNTGILVKRERFVGYCARTVPLPVPVVPDSARITYTDGILCVRLMRATAGTGADGVTLLRVTAP